MRRGRTGFWVALALAFVSAGQARDPESAREGFLLPDEDSAFIVAITGDDATFTWLSKTNRTYVIFAAEREASTPRWAPVPGMDPIAGNGERVTIRIRIPGAQRFRYSLRTFAPRPERRRWWR